MGQLLTISLACTLFCTLIVLPALLGSAPAARTEAAYPAAKEKASADG